MLRKAVRRASGGRHVGKPVAGLVQHQPFRRPDQRPLAAVRRQEQPVQGVEIMEGIRQRLMRDIHAVDLRHRVMKHLRHFGQLLRRQPRSGSSRRNGG